MTVKTKITTATLLFMVVVILHFLGLFYNDLLAFVTKPFLITSLVFVYLVSVKKANFWYVSALFFSFWGDVLLLFKNQYFVFGLCSFLVAHLLYIKLVLASVVKISLQKFILISLPFVFYLLSFFYLILDKVVDIKAPIIIYGLVISVFGALSFLNYQQNKTKASLLLFLGAILFILSDSLIALNRFYNTSSDKQVLIMFTYILAQFLICKAFIGKASYQE